MFFASLPGQFIVSFSLLTHPGPFARHFCSSSNGNRMKSFLHSYKLFVVWCGSLAFKSCALVALALFPSAETPLLAEEALPPSSVEALTANVQARFDEIETAHFVFYHFIRGKVPIPQSRESVMAMINDDTYLNNGPEWMQKFASTFLGEHVDENFVLERLQGEIWFDVHKRQVRQETNDMVHLHDGNMNLTKDVINNQLSYGERPDVYAILTLRDFCLPMRPEQMKRMTFIDETDDGLQFAGSSEKWSGEVLFDAVYGLPKHVSMRSPQGKLIREYFQLGRIVDTDTGAIAPRLAARIDYVDNAPSFFNVIQIREAELNKPIDSSQFRMASQEGMTMIRRGVARGKDTSYRAGEASNDVAKSPPRSVEVMAAVKSNISMKKGGGKSRLFLFLNLAIVVVLLLSIVLRKRTAKSGI